jgi:hypothetical protein
MIMAIKGVDKRLEEVLRLKMILEVICCYFEALTF